MATISLQTALSGPTDNGGTCRVLYEVTNADGLAPEIFVVRYYPPPYQGADPMYIWEHVAYADELTNISVNLIGKGQQLVRKATALVEYPSLDAAETAIRSIRSQIQRLVNEVNTLTKYLDVNTYIISSTN